MKTLYSLIAGLRPADSTLARRLAIALLPLTAGMMLVQPSAAQSGTWTETGSLATGRELHTETLLPNGKVLVAGGFNDGILPASAELYDPASGTWAETGSLGIVRDDHTATLLPNGKVLVAGGYGGDFPGSALASAELYDPGTGIWTETGSLAEAREFHTATLLPNGKVLVAGGGNGSPYALASAELYDPASGTWTVTGSVAAARTRHTATLLPNGKVLVAGGFGDSGALASAELYDPATGTWTVTGSLATARGVHTAMLLPNGKVLAAGGAGNPCCSSLPSAELYDPATGTWTETGSLTTERWTHTATLLPNGKVLVAGGDNGGLYALASAELYDPAIGTWTATDSLVTGRGSHTATLLPNGKVLAAGGFCCNGLFGPDTYGDLASAELYDVGRIELTLVSAASLGRGGFAINLPLTGPSGVEDRSTLPNKKLTIAMTFDNAIASVGGVSSTRGSVSDISINGNTVTVKLVDVPHGCNGTNVDVTANDVLDDQGNTLSSATATVGLLLGDANGDRVVSPADRHLVKGLKGQHIDSTNFRSDVSSDGYIGSADVRLVKQQQGTSLP